MQGKDTQAKILALGKGLPTLLAVITKAEAEGDTRRVAKGEIIEEITLQSKYQYLYCLKVRM